MQDQSQDFEKLRQLLALKRHENPPPGYFRDFSRQVWVQIESADARRREGWLRQLTRLFQTRPAISWSFCMATGLVVIAASTLFVGESPNAATDATTVNAIAAMADQPVAAPAAGAFLVTNLEPRQFALEMAPPQMATTTSNSLFSIPFYQRTGLGSDFKGEQVPAKHELLYKP